MGYNHEYFPFSVQDWMNRGWLTPGHRLIEFGAQEFFSEPDETCRITRAFLIKNGVDSTVADGVVGKKLPSVAVIYEVLGIDYTSVDVDGAFGSTFFDLNAFAVPPEWMGVFDFINDEGTVEHLVNPINGFHVAHDMAKVGGIIRHSFPLIGWREHGFFYPTTKFCAHLVGDNGYELLRAEASFNRHTPFDDPFFKLPSGAPPVTDMWAELIYRKVLDQPFVIPVDHVGGPSAKSTKHRLREHYDRAARSRYSPT